MDHMTLCLSTMFLLFVNLGTESLTPDPTSAMSSVNNFASNKSSDPPTDHTVGETSPPVNIKLSTEKSITVTKDDARTSDITLSEKDSTTDSSQSFPLTHVSVSAYTGTTQAPELTSITHRNNEQGTTTTTTTTTTNIYAGLSISQGGASAMLITDQPDSPPSPPSIHTVSFKYTSLKTDGEITTVTNDISKGASPTAKTFTTVGKGDTYLNGTTENGVHETDITTWSSVKTDTSITDDNVGSTPSTQRASAATQTGIHMNTRPSLDKGKNVSHQTVYTEVSKKFTATQTLPSSNMTTTTPTKSLNSSAVYNFSSGTPSTRETTKPTTNTGERTSTNSTSTPTLTKTEMTLLSTATSDPGNFGGLTSTKSPPDSYVNVAAKDITIQMELSVADNFTVDLKNTSSAKFKSYEEKFRGYLTELYGNIQGFKSVSITGFRNGSIVATYLLELNNVSSIRQAVRDVNSTLRNDIQDNSTWNKYNLTIEVPKTLALLDTTLQEIKDICHLYRQPCLFGYQCTSTNSLNYTCDSKCAKKYNPCGANGECIINHQDEHVKCRCIEDDTHVYSGQFCEVATEKLKLKSTYIIIIGASGGAAFLVVIVVLSVCLWRIRAKNRMKIKENEEDNSYRSHSMVDLHSVTDFDSRRSRTQTLDNNYDSGLPDIRFYHGREHRVVKENGFGLELYIYSPSTSPRESDKHSIQESRSSRPGSVYEHIDTNTKFEIKRPNIIEPSHQF